MTSTLWMTTTEIANALDVSRETVLRLIRIGAIEGGRKRDGSYRAKASSVYHYRATRQGGSK
jgi:excisionase family DNA binding protein